MTVQSTGTRLACSKSMRARILTQGVAGACVFIGMNSAYAQATAVQSNNTDNLPEVVITAARSEQIVTDALPSTTVITRADIEKAPVSDVVSLLRMQTGVVIRQSGPQGNAVSVNIRGGDPRHTLVLLDGVPMNSLSAGTGALEQIPLAAIEKIEIVRGNVSALYGSQATGGVVQVFTRKVGSGQDATIRVAAGSHGQRQASAQVRGGNDKVQATFGISHDEVRAVSAQYPVDTTNPANPDKDGYKNNSANGSIRYRPNDNNEFGVLFFESRGKNQYDNDWGSYTAGVQKVATRVQNVSLYANNRVTDKWKSSLRVSQYLDRSDDYDSAPTPDSQFYGADGYSLYKVKTKDFSWQNDFHSSVGDFILGFSRTNQRLETDSLYNNTFRGTTSLWGGYILDKNRHHLQLNARTDKLSDLNREYTASVNYGFDVSPSWRIFAGYSNGFSAPTLNDLFASSVLANPNPNLKAEHALYTQVGVQFSNEYFTGRLTTFETRYKDKIAYAYGSDFKSTPVNLNKAKARGVEWHGSYNRDGWTVDLGLTYQEVTDSDTGKRLLRQPRVLANIGVGKAWGKWGTQINWEARGGMLDWNGALAGYGVLNAAAFYNVTKDLKLGLSVGNVFNRNYQPLYGYNAMPRNVLLSLQYQPKW